MLKGDGDNDGDDGWDSELGWKLGGAIGPLEPGSVARGVGVLNSALNDVNDVMGGNEDGIVDCVYVSGTLLVVAGLSVRTAVDIEKDEGNEDGTVVGTVELPES